MSPQESRGKKRIAEVVSAHWPKTPLAPSLGSEDARRRLTGR
jgi:hypothetical protein